MREETSRILRLPFAAEDIDQLPRFWHKGKPDERKIMLDYVGHAAATDRLLDADIEWAWEPFAVDEQGLPCIIRRGDCLELWIRLTIDGTSRPGVGSVPVEYDRDTGAELPEDQDTAKELIGDAIRNAAMRFGVALNLWRKHDSEEAPAVPSGPPCPHCRAPVAFLDEKTRGRKPAWSCSNRACGGGGPRDKADPSKGNWPWGSYNADFFANQETGGPLEVPPLTGPGAPAPSPDAFDNLDVNLQVLGVDQDQAEAELQTYRDSGGFAAGHVKEIRERVNRACVLLVALGHEPEGVQGELWREYQSEDLDNRRTLSWSTVKGTDVPSFARHVQAFLRARLV